MEAANGDTVPPSFTMLELSVHAESIQYVFLFNGTRFFITVFAKDLEGEATLLQEFNEFKSDIDDDPETLYNFEEWVLAALGDDLMQKVAPTPARDAASRKPITLLEYFSPPTYAFRLVNREGKLCPVREDFDPQVHGDTSPRTKIVEDCSPPRGAGRRRNSGSSSSTTTTASFSGVLYKSALPPVPIVSASHLERVDDGLRDEELSDIPRKVRRVDTGEVFFFKAGFAGHGHLREIDILSQIARNDKLSPSFPTSRLEGLVVWGVGDDSTVLMGMLMNYIEGQTLADRMDRESVATRLKWFRQVQATVGRLHDCGTVWGDVKPDNVIINANEDAVVVDFGGGYTPEYIAPELQQTMQGDLVGLDHMAEMMGIRHETS